MSDTPKQVERPLSPHLQVYSPQLTTVMSILHRATGYALSVGTVMVVWLLVAAASGPEAFATFAWFTGTLVGKLLLAGWSFALCYHMCNGVRHLFWDMGYLFKIESAYKAGFLVWITSIMMTAVIWWYACPFTGAE